MIEFKDVSYATGKKEILHQVSFRLPKGKITSIIGKNGAGKTSALRCLTGEIQYTGQILLCGTDIKKISASERARKVSCLPQILKDVPFTVYELASLGRRPYQKRIGKATKRDIELIKYALHLTDMLSFSNRRVDTLSGGEKQRAYLSMVLAQNTDVIALDEPATYMDASVEKELHVLLKKLCEENGKTIVQIMHNLSRAVNQSDSIVVMDSGRMIRQMDADEARNGKLIEEMFSVQKGFFVLESGEKQTAFM